MNKSRMNGAADALRYIQELSFTKAELELFLDTHPECSAALDYYKRTVEELRAATAAYEAAYGPIKADGVTGERWSWVDMPWPWFSGIEKTTDKRQEVR